MFKNKSDFPEFKEYRSFLSIPVIGESREIQITRSSKEVRFAEISYILVETYK